jgi:cytochrome c biogenesis factor
MVRKRTGDTSHQRAAVLLSISECLLIIIIFSWLAILFYDSGHSFSLRSIDFRYVFGVMVLIVIGCNYLIFLKDRRYVRIHSLYKGKYSERKAKAIAISILFITFFGMIVSGIFLSKTINGW